MTFEQLTRTYLGRLQQNCREALAQGASSVEMAVRPTVHDYICKVVERVRTGVRVHHDLQVRGTCNRPDWTLEDPDTFGIFGYGDHKSLQLEGAYQLSEGETRQMRRYLELGRPLFVFDGVEFLWWWPQQSEGRPLRISLVPKPLSLDGDWSSLPVNPTAEQQFAELLAGPGFRKWTERDLIEQLASRARLLSGTIEALLESSPGGAATLVEREVLDALHGLWRMVRDHHDPRLRDARSAADFVAQVLVFGLFYAHGRLSPMSDPNDARKNHIRSYWFEGGSGSSASRMRPFQGITEALGSVLRKDNDLGHWYRECAALLAHATYMGVEGGETDYHALFERFFARFDNKARFERGVFYTPPELARWLAHSVDALARARFGHSAARLADRIIDPCCGTGGILEELIAVWREEPQVGVTTFVGFEVLPGPYVLAHHRLERVAAAAQVPVCLLLTDTLSDTIAATDTESAFTRERREVSEMSRRPLRIVVGNPPSSDTVASGAPRGRITTLLEDFRPPKEDRTDRQNIQRAINDESYRFLRWSTEQVLESDRGLIALLLPDSFAYRPSFRWARRWLVRHFDDVRVLMVDHDARGSDGQSLFGVQQGRLVLWAAHGDEGVKSAARISFLDLRARSRDEKLAYFAAKAGFADFEGLEIDPEDPIFLPRRPFPEVAWELCWPMRSVAGRAGIFLDKCSGVKLSPVSTLVHTDEEILLRRSRDVAREKDGVFAQPFEQLVRTWWKGQAKPPNQTKLTERVRRAVGGAAAARETVVVSYRPFLQAHALYGKALMDALADAPGDGTRPRPELRAAFAHGAVGIALAPDPTAVGDTLTRIASFVWHLPDNDLAARGNAMIHCDQHPDVARGGSAWNASVRINVHPAFLAYFGHHEQPARAAVFYSYAVLSSSAWLETFQGVLYRESNPDDPPRLPLLSDPHARDRLVALGQRIAQLEQASSAAELPLALELSWPADKKEFELKDWTYDEPTRRLTLRDATLTTQVSLAPVPPAVVELSISGHEVVRKWLREYSFPYLRRTFRYTDLETLGRLVSCIAEQQQLLEQVNAVLCPALDDEGATTLLQAPPPRSGAPGRAPRGRDPEVATGASSRRRRRPPGRGSLGHTPES